MLHFEHDQIARRIAELSVAPGADDDYTRWYMAADHLNFLQSNGLKSDVVVYASAHRTFVHAITITEDSFRRLSHHDLMRWSGNPFSLSASYAWGAGGSGVWVEPLFGFLRTQHQVEGRQLIFRRHFEGLQGSDATYFELLQEFAHLADVHWRPEIRSYCRFDIHGDFEPVVTTSSNDRSHGVDLVTFLREPLDEYLESSNSVLLRMFEFQLVKNASELIASGDSVDRQETEHETEDMIYKRTVFGNAGAFTRGVQIIRPVRTRDSIFSAITSGRHEWQNEEFCEFVAWDWRNKRIAEVSTNPLATTSYFDAEENSLPFETTPAFFRPDVLLKYKADREKYSIDEDSRLIRCRGGWSLQSFDFNEAGQVHAYICDLADLPLKEQQYWLSFNERPRAGISERALRNDFEAKWFASVDPASELRAVLRDWNKNGVSWWNASDLQIERLVAPHANSQDEWAASFLELSKLVIEGLNASIIKSALESRGLRVAKGTKSLAMLETLLQDLGIFEQDEKLAGLRIAWRIRSVTATHSAGRTAKELAMQALQEHGTFGDHFRSICARINQELGAIEEAFGRIERRLI